MKKIWILPIIAFVCAITFIVALCHRSISIPNSIDSLNKPVRIVSLAPNITEILFALGLGDRVIAVSDDSDYPEQVKKIKKIGAFFKPSTEVVIACEPDLVITLWFLEQKAVADSLRRLDYNVLTLELQKLDQLNPAIEKIGQAARAEISSEKLIEKINTQLQQIKNKYRTSIKPKVLWVVQNEPVRVAGKKTFINELIELAGGQNAIEPTLMQYPQIGTENLLTCGAEVIIHSAMSKDNITNEQQAVKRFWEKYPELPAVKNKRIYVVDPDTTLRLGPRLPQGIDFVARLLHPDK
jgi:iron complex transport system substrate-binding protein